MKNLYAYTETPEPTAGVYYPAYLSINEVEGKVMFTVRRRGEQNGQQIELPRQELLRLVAALMKVPT